MFPICYPLDLSQTCYTQQPELVVALGPTWFGGTTYEGDKDTVGREVPGAEHDLELGLNQGIGTNASQE